MQKPITIFCAFTREWAVDRWLDNLNHVKHDPALTNLCFIVDIDDPRIKIKLQQYAEAGKYRSFHVKLNDDWHAQRSAPWHSPDAHCRCAQSEQVAYCRKPMANTSLA
jgi:hypothetical protein